MQNMRRPRPHLSANRFGAAFDDAANLLLRDGFGCIGSEIDVHVADLPVPNREDLGVSARRLPVALHSIPHEDGVTVLEQILEVEGADMLAIRPALREVLAAANAIVHRTCEGTRVQTCPCVRMLRSKPGRF